MTPGSFSLKTFVVVTALCLAVREEFPFSHFPMYGSFANYTYYVYVTGGDGKPVALNTLTGVRAANLKKIYDSELDALKKEVKEKTGDWRGVRSLSAEDRRPSGEHALEWLRENSKDPEALAAVGALTFHHVGLNIDDGKFVKEDDAVATIR